MVQQVTKGVKVSVKTAFNGMVTHNDTSYYAFNYFISIENNSKDTLKLTERFWNIYDSLNDVDFVEGEGVVGQTPILPPKERYNYQSSCYLISNMGAMNGFYKMINLTTNTELIVKIPTFQFFTTPLAN